MSEFILESREMAVGSLESGHSAELISFKGGNFVEVSIKLYIATSPLNLCTSFICLSLTIEIDLNYIFSSSKTFKAEKASLIRTILGQATNYE